MACRIRWIAVMLGVAGMGFAAPGHATGESAQFDVYLLGLRAGTLSYAARESDAAYTVTGQVRSAGVIGAIADFRMDATAKGRKNRGAYRPQSYVETSVDNKERSERSIRYDARGTPELISDEPPKPYWFPADRQRGALDPMTAIYELLRDRGGTSPCVLDATFGDGARLGRIVSAETALSAETATCRGRYERKGGFSPKELEAGKTFPFTLEYQLRGDVWQLAEVRIDSVHGRAHLVRR